MQTTENPAIGSPPERGLSSRATRCLLVVAVVLGLLLNIGSVFNLTALARIQIMDTFYIYALMGLFLALVFLYYPTGRSRTARIEWYDWLGAAASLGICGYFAWNSQRIIQEGWDMFAPVPVTVLAAVLCFLALEAVRRVGSMSLCLICFFFFLFPLFAENMPGFLWGPASDPGELVRMHSLGTESIIGAPVRVVISTLFGFLVFGTALLVTGGGAFFMDFSNALLGRSRGGPAKVAIVSSGFFGSLSGSVISNVVTTGQMTIPTMKRIGYPSNYSAAVEACTSTGGALMPPVMGAVAFIMAEYLNVPYSTVLIAAIVPAVLYYLALLFQVDCYAAKKDLQGHSGRDLPSLAVTLARGWYFIAALVLLVVVLLTSGNEARAPYYATAFLLVCGMVRRTDRLRLRDFNHLIVEAGRSIAGIIGLLVGVGMIVGSLSYTGVGGAFSRELLQYAGHNVALMLVLGAATSFVLGMGMTASACYIFLATVLAPAMIGIGLDPVASHLFILYWGMLSFITPPVALAALAAAGIANADAFRTGFLSMRLGLVNFILPFLFVISPTLTLNGPIVEIVQDVAVAVIAIWLMSSAFEGWLYGIGRISWVPRGLLLVSTGLLFQTSLVTDLLGVLIFAAIYGGLWLQRRRLPRSP